MTIGLDISTSVVGIALFDDKDKLCELKYIKFKEKISLFEKLNNFIEYMEEEKYDILPIKNVSIEEPLKKFKGKFSNANTIQKLTMMNAMISGYMYRTFNVEPRYYNVNTARKTVFPALTIPQSASNKKYIIWEKVVEKEPQINWKYSKKTHKLMKENFDMSDAYICGLCDIINRVKSEKAKVKESETESLSTPKPPKPPKDRKIKEGEIPEESKGNKNK